MTVYVTYSTGNKVKPVFVSKNILIDFTKKLPNWGRSCAIFPVISSNAESGGSV